MLSRRLALVSLALWSVLAGCAGPNSRLVTVRSGHGDGPVDFAVKNATSAPINALYLAKTERVTGAGEGLSFDSAQGQDLWGPDLLSHSAIGAGDRTKITVSEAGVWDVRALDRDGRYQHVTGLRLAPGGRYVLELNEGGWRVK